MVKVFKLLLVDRPEESVYSISLRIVISDPTDDPDDPENTIVLTSVSLSDIINQIKETEHGGKGIISDIEEITQNIKDILQTINNLKDRLNDNQEKIEEHENKNDEQDEL
jgi:methyl-accepting chemotaxis protein